jgi:transposase-like protein
MVAAAIRTIFAQPDAEHVHAQFDVVAGMLGRQFPAVEAMLREARTTCWPSPASRSGTGRRSGRPIRWNG